MNRRWRTAFFAFVVGMIGMWFFSSLAQWNDSKDQRNDIRRHNKKLRERTSTLEVEQQHLLLLLLTADPNDAK